MRVRLHRRQALAAQLPEVLRAAGVRHQFIALGAGAGANVLLRYACDAAERDVIARRTAARAAEAEAQVPDLSSRRPPASPSPRRGFARRTVFAPRQKTPAVVRRL